MKTPPFLIFATLLFWGWQSDLLLVGAVLGVVLESSRFTNWRWELDDTDFNRIWSFCVVLNVALVGYVFTTNDAGGGLSGLLHGNAARNAANSGVVTAIRFMRWLPMTTFPFVAAQMFNVRPTIPLTAVSMVLRWRRRKGESAFAGRYFSISYPYFIVCLFSAGIHANNGSQTYFWGQCALIGWALWSLRSRRFGINFWVLALAVVIGLGFLGQFGINEAQRVIQNFNASWMARFFAHKTDVTQSMTSMGDIGDLKLSAKIVIRLQPKIVGEVPAYLHEASYRTYNPRSRTWYAGGTVNDPFDIVQPETDNTSWILIPAKTNSASVNIACYLDGRSPDGDSEGVLPLPSGSSRLENLTEFVGVYALKKNKTGAVLATGPGLMIFDARYGPGAAVDSAPDASTNNFDLNVSPDEVPALDAVISEIKISPGDDDQKKLLAVERFFAANFTYSTWQGEDKKATTNATPLTRFLLTSRSGHCEYFATSTVLVLRRLGIPARYAVGYAVHEASGSGYVVRERDAHAWCLAWNAATKSWDDFDTTPASWVAVESGRASFLDWLSDLKSWLGFQFEKFRWRQAHLQQYIFWSLIPVLAVLLYHIIFRRRGKLKSLKGKNENVAPVIWPGLDSEFYQLESKLAARGLPRQPSELLSDWLERALMEPALADLRAPLQKLLQLHYRHRFDPQGLNVDEREKLKREVKDCLDALLQAGKSR
jgi:transglutaminase-like putative cysteine protease